AALVKLGGSSASHDKVTSAAATAPVIATMRPRRNRTAGRGRPRSTKASGSSFGRGGGAGSTGSLMTPSANRERSGPPAAGARLAEARQPRTGDRRHNSAPGPGN